MLALLILSYRETIKAYPSAGGAYLVTRDNFGIVPAQVAGASLLVGYVLTVAVSVSAGTAALISSFESLAPLRIPISLMFIAIVMYGNLRGVKESGKVFAVPTYFFMLNMGVLLVYGFVRYIGGDLDAITSYAEGTLEVGHASKDAGLYLGATAFLLAKAFASGGAAVTGVEAISNGVPAFKEPAWKNARQTLVVMGSGLAVMFLGLSLLASKVKVIPFEDGTPTVLAQIGEAVFGHGALGDVLTYSLQASTMLILVLAANTGFADFPRLASFQASDSFLPRQLTKRGHRLVFSNGILALAGTAGLLVVVTNAEVTKLIPLYAIGVFVGFTLSQAGMTKHHLRLKEPGWRKSLVVNGVGACISAGVVLVVAVTKFGDGAWIMVVAMPLLVLDAAATQPAVHEGSRRPRARRAGRGHRSDPAPSCGARVRRPPRHGHRPRHPVRPNPHPRRDAGCSLRRGRDRGRRAGGDLEARPGCSGCRSRSRLARTDASRALPSSWSLASSSTARPR